MAHQNEKMGYDNTLKQKGEGENEKGGDV